MLVIEILVAALVVAGMYKVFEKAGLEGWKAIIPVYNVYVMLELFGYNPWLTLLLFVPIANVVLLVMLNDKVAKAFNKTTGYTVGLTLLPMVFYPLLGFTDEKFQLK